MTHKYYTSCDWFDYCSHQRQTAPEFTCKRPETSPPKQNSCLIQFTPAISDCVQMNRTSGFKRSGLRSTVLNKAGCEHEPFFYNENFFIIQSLLQILLREIILSCLATYTTINVCMRPMNNMHMIWYMYFKTLLQMCHGTFASLSEI